jgi:hypothetical protein
MAYLAVNKDRIIVVNTYVSAMLATYKAYKQEIKKRGLNYE